jgi:hypothetical protein
MHVPLTVADGTWREICRATTWHTQRNSSSPRVALRSTRGYSKVTATRSKNYAIQNLACYSKVTATRSKNYANQNLARSRENPILLRTFQ